MALIVQKYGGTSVGSVERIQHVANKVAGFRADGHDVVVVVSAMSGETNRLIGLAHAISETPVPREMDVLVSTGEQVTIALVAMALNEIGVSARSYTGGQVRIHTDSAFMKARIEAIDDAAIRADLAAGSVVIVAGFQGMDGAGNITTLGRGGSDTTAVALAAALKANECQIYPMSMGSTPRILGSYQRPGVCRKSPLRKCWKWHRLAPRCCKFGLWSLRVSTTSHCECYRVLKMALAP